MTRIGEKVLEASGGVHGRVLDGDSADAKESSGDDAPFCAWHEGHSVESRGESGRVVAPLWREKTKPSAVLVAKAETKNGAGEERPSSAEIVFEIDRSGSMARNMGGVVRRIGEVIREKKEQGVVDLRVGVETFGYKGINQTIFPMTLMDEEGVARLFEILGEDVAVALFSHDSSENVGEAAVRGATMFEEHRASRTVFVLTDADGLDDDKRNSPNQRDAVLIGEERGVSINVESLEGTEMVFLHNVARVQKLVIAGDRDSIITLALDGDESPDLRLEAARELANVEQADMRGLIALAQDGTAFVEARFEAAKELAELGNKTGRDVLVSIALNRDERPAISTEAVMALASRGKVAEAELRAIAQDSGELSLISIAAAGELARMGCQIGEDILYYRAYEGTLPPPTRLKAATELAKLGKKSGRDVLLAFAKDGAVTNYVRFTAAETLAEWRDKTGIDTLVSMARDGATPGSYRIAAAKALEGKKDEIRRDVLVSIARDDKEYVEYRLDAAMALDGKDDKIRRDALVSIALSSAYPSYIRIKAAGLLACQESRTGRDVLGSIARHRYEHSSTRLDAARELARCVQKNEEAKPALLALAMDSGAPQDARLEAAIALAEREDETGRDLLFDFLKDSDTHPDIRLGAAKALARMGYRIGRDGLLALAKDANAPYDVKFDAALVLRDLGDRSGFQILGRKQ